MSLAISDCPGWEEGSPGAVGQMKAKWGEVMWDGLGDKGQVSEEQGGKMVSFSP